MPRLPRGISILEGLLGSDYIRVGNFSPDKTTSKMSCNIIQPMQHYPARTLPRPTIFEILFDPNGGLMLGWDTPSRVVSGRNI